MKAIQAEYEEEPRAISIKDGAVDQDWPTVCRRFNDDVERICDVGDMEDYTGLYACYDDAGKPVYYLVKEDKALFKMKRRRFLNNVGIKP